ncbi:MAG: prepilin-type N-terminal cleavage/methylation domain-containing protein [Nitrospirae bacterium]|nr:prepilin-type N-terminal cleavage/methylation domain-containing protein [Nitrospirota bacterium]
MKEKGFTLVELAIVMVIIGLLIGAVLKGQAMIESAKIKNLADQYNSLVAAVYSYQDKYGVFPGDDSSATARSWATGSCATTAGDGSGVISVAEGLAANEHLACSGLIKGSYNGTTTAMTHTYGGTVAINSATLQGRTGNSVQFVNLLAENAESLDRILDDGVYTTGSCRANAAYTAGTTIANFRCFL